MPNIKFHGAKKPHHHVRDYFSALTLKGIDKDIFHIIFHWTFIKDVMRWYNTVVSSKSTNWDDLCKEFRHQYSYNADITIRLRDPDLTNRQENESFLCFLAWWRRLIWQIDPQRMAKQGYLLGMLACLWKRVSTQEDLTSPMHKNRQILKSFIMSWVFKFLFLFKSEV